MNILARQGIPMLATERLLLRAPVESDFPAYEHFLASPRSRGMGGPFNTRAAWGMFCHDVVCWCLFGHGALMVDHRGTGRCVGQVGINDGPLFPEKELGWLVYEGYEGLGYATEAAAALRDWAGRALGCSGLVSYIDPDNRASIRVAGRLGAALDLTAPKQDEGGLVYRHGSKV
jgi:RimJ/RimL family protein N-acetyltransferase